MGTAPSSGVFATKVDDFIDEYSQNDILYYDPSECVDGEGNNKTCVLPTGDQITWIGDSYSVGAKTEIEAEFSGISFGPSVDDEKSQIKVGKNVDNGSDNNPSGLTILKKIIDEDKLKPYLVFALGTNDKWNDSKVKKFNELLSGKDTKVVLVNSKIPNDDYAESNKTLKEMVDANENYSLADWAKVSDDSWFNDGIHPNQGDGYKTWVGAIKDAMPKNCSGKLCGSNAKEKYWSALSNHFGAASAAGIMGNIDNEGGLSPTLMEQTPTHMAYNLSTHQWVNGWSKTDYFKRNDSPQTGNITGLGAFQISSSRVEYLKYVTSTESELAQYFQDPDKYSTGDGDKLIGLIGEANFDRMVELEIEWMYKSLEEDPIFDLDKFKNMGDAGEAAIYFLLKYERPADQGEAEQQERANAGKRAYEDLKDFKCSQAGSNTSFTSTEDLSSNANIKYDASDEELEKLLKFAIWEAKESDSNYRVILSKILDEYELGGGEKGKTAELIRYVENDSAFSYREDYDKFVKDNPKVKITSGEREGAKIVLIDGIRSTSSASATFTTSRLPSVDYCPSGKKAGNGKIAEIAALMSWPIQSWQTEADDFKSNLVGKCDGGSGSWIDYQFDTEPCMSNPRDLYRKNYNTFPGQGWYDMYMDCGYFVSTVLHYVGVADETTKYKMTGQPTMAGAGEYSPGDLEESSDWKEVENKGESSMKPGDVLINNQHVMIYVGEKYGGEYGTVAHASRGTRVGEVGSLKGAENYRIYRYSGSKLSGGDAEGGLDYEQAKQFMMSYGENKNNSSRDAVPNLWDNCNGGGSNCVTFSAFFMNKFTSMQYGGGNGNQVVSNVTGKFTRGTEPQIWAVFSWDSSDGYGHTGVILGKDGDEWIVGHASCDSSGIGRGDGTQQGGGAGVVVKSSDISVACWGTPSGYAYPDSVDTDAISTFMETGQ